MNNAFTGVGTRLLRKNGAEWLRLAGVSNVNGPSATRDTADATSFDNTDGYRDFITTLRDGGTLTFDLLFNKTQYAQMLADFEDNDVQTYMIFFAQAQAGAILFDGLVTDVPLNVPFDDKVTVSVTIKVTGEIDVPDNGPYLIEYDANGATDGEVPGEQIKAHGVNITLRANTGALARDDYNFIGWNTKEDGSGTPYNVSANYAADDYVILYAEWEQA